MKNVALGSLHSQENPLEREKTSYLIFKFKKNYFAMVKHQDISPSTPWGSKKKEKVKWHTTFSLKPYKHKANKLEGSKNKA